jgi:anti-sigma regulatory factor (Ser/Thr protein kinase)
MVIAQKEPGLLACEQPVVGDEKAARIDLVTLPSSPFWARRHTEQALRAWDVAHLADTADLLVTELVTNAVAFAGAGSDAEGEAVAVRRIWLALRLLAGQLIIEVGDPDPRPPVRAADVSTDAENGRGLMLVEALSNRWDYYLPPSGGKVVYCVIDA